MKTVEFQKSHMYLNIKESAIFIADSHFNKLNQQFLTLLKKIQNKEIETSQIFLMGDMIDFISGESKYFIKENKEVIDILNELSSYIEIIYLEGNHDYNLKKLFPLIKVYSRDEQPLMAKYKDKTVGLSHGDNFINWHYDLYCKVIRNSLLLKFLNLIDFNYFISKRIEEALLKKNICHKMDYFENIVNKRKNNYKTDIIIEGHYHQGKTFEFDNQKYVNIPSLCCDNKFTRLTDYNFQGETI